MKKSLAISIALCLCMINGLGQKIIRGCVIDHFNRQPLELAYVKTDNDKLFAITDEGGRFSLRVNDEKQFVVGLFGYTSVSFPLKDSSDFFLIPLVRAQADLKEVYITANSLNAGFRAISKIDLNLSPVRSTQDVLKLVPGLFIAQHQGGGKAEQIFLRGFDADHGTDINISVDGLPVNMVSHSHGQGYADLHFLIPETVGNIEYGKGPYSAKVGNLATAGFARFSTVDVLGKNIFKIEAGQFNTMRGLAMAEILSKKLRDKGTNAYIASEFLFILGPFVLPQHFKRFNAFGKFNTKLGKDSRLTVFASTFSSKWNASGQIPERAVNSGMIDRFGYIDSVEGGYTGRTNISAKFTDDFRNGSWENQVYISRYSFKLLSDFTFFLTDTLNGDRIRQQETRNIFGYQSRFTHSYHFGRAQLFSEGGLGFRFDKTNNSELAHMLDKNELLKYKQLGNVDEKNVFFYISERLTSGKWVFNLASRVDYFQFDYANKLTTQQLPARSSIVVSPKINVQYRLNNQTQVYLKLGKGFHSNDSRSVVMANRKKILPAAYGADFGAFLKPTPTLLLNFAAWYLYVEDELLYVGDEGIVESNGKTRRTGIDLSARYQFNKWLFADLNLNLARPKSLEQPKGEDYLPLAPTFTSTGGLSWKMKNGFNGSIKYRYLKKRPANEDNSIVAHGYTITDLSFNYTRKKYEAGFVIENLFNVKWNEAQFATESRLKNEPASVEEIHFTPGTPFSLRLKIAVFF